MDHPNKVFEKMGQGVVTPGATGSMGLAPQEKEIEFDSISNAAVVTEKMSVSSAADRKSTRLNSSHRSLSRMPSSA